MNQHSPSTLAHYLAAPQRHAVSLSHLTVADVSQNRKLYGTHKDYTNPHYEAAKLYTMNHLFGLIQQRRGPLDQLTDLEFRVCDRYIKTLAEQVSRMFFYVTIICVREARHLYTMPETWWQSICNDPVDAQAFKAFSANNKGSEGAALKQFENSPPNMKFETFIEAISRLFHKGKFSSGYGGPAWGGIADCLLRFIRGEGSAEIFVDAAYALCHNGGPIFNKGFYYHAVSKNDIEQILDCQRAGSSCEFVITNGHYSKSCPDEVKLIKEWAKEYPTDLSSKVDWNKVVKLGAVGHAAKHLAAAEVAMAPVVSPFPKGAKAGAEIPIWQNVVVKTYERAEA